MYWTRSGKPLITGHLDVCLCVSVIPHFVEVNVAAQAAVVLLGKVRVIAIIEALVSTFLLSSFLFPF